MISPNAPIVTVFARSPDEGRGLARDMRVRWTLEEVGQSYEIRAVSFAAQKEAAHRAFHPFGQIPTYEDADICLFESAAIFLHIASHHAGLLSRDPTARSRAINWMFAAVSTIEPTIVERETAIYLEREEPWFAQRLRSVEDRIHAKLTDLSRRLGDADWMDGTFSAGDLIVIDVLRRLGGSGLLEAFPNLAPMSLTAKPAQRFGGLLTINALFSTQPQRDRRSTTRTITEGRDQKWNRRSTSFSRAIVLRR